MKSSTAAASSSDRRASDQPPRPLHHRPQSRKRQHHHQNPKRGGPGILFTCETGRERKCQHQGLDILRYYHGSDKDSTASGVLRKDKANKGKEEETTGKSNTEEQSRRQSLDAELALLRQQGNSGHKAVASNQDGAMEDPFAVYETGCRGSVFVLWTGTTDQKDASTTPPTKKQRTSESVTLSSDGTSPTLWDPIRTVECIVEDMTKGQTHTGGSISQASQRAAIPSSRFVTRIIPIQATCFASLEEIERTVQSLLIKTVEQLQSGNPPDGLEPSENNTDTPATTTATTFAIKVKKRNCSTFSSQEIIDCVAKLVGTVTKNHPWKVDLRHPDKVVHIEVCKTLTGISILPSALLESLPNLNLAELRVRLSCRDGDDEDDTQ